MKQVFINYIFVKYLMGIGDWGLGVWGLGVGVWGPTPLPPPTHHTPKIPNPKKDKSKMINKKNNN